MNRVRKAFVPLVVVGSLTAGVACTAPPPPQDQASNVLVGIIEFVLLALYLNSGGCIAPCDPAPGG